MKDSEKQETSIWREAKIGFVYGAASMIGGMLMLSAYANRDKIKRVVRYAIQEAR